MPSEREEFVAEGMKRYREAALILVNFGREIEASLKTVLEKPRDWGKFAPKKEVRAKSTKYWSEYPLLNARLEGDFNGEDIVLIIAVNWYKSNTDYPFYAIRIETQKNYDAELKQFQWKDPFQYKESALRYLPDPDDFNLARDFDQLIEEFARFLMK